MRITTRSTLTAAALTLVLGGPVRADHEDNGKEHHHEVVKMQDVPPAVQETLRKEAKGGEIHELRREKRSNGDVIYEAEVKKNGQETELEIDGTGRVLERETEHENDKPAQPQQKP
jgi:uncharacterized membrane protein YkoI